MNQSYFVEYEVDGFQGVKQAGPYQGQEAEDHMLDIKGYDGVRNVKLVPVDEEDQS
jgi:hypothetical protein